MLGHLCTPACCLVCGPALVHPLCAWVCACCGAACSACSTAVYCGVPLKQQFVSRQCMSAAGGLQCNCMGLCETVGATHSGASSSTLIYPGKSCCVCSHAQHAAAAPSRLFSCLVASMAAVPAASRPSVGTDLGQEGMSSSCFCGGALWGVFILLKCTLKRVCLPCECSSKHWACSGGWCAHRGWGFQVWVLYPPTPQAPCASGRRLFGKRSC